MAYTAEMPEARRPAFLNMLPPRFREWVYARFYSRRHAEYLGLYKRAPLALAPQVAMYDLRPGCIISGHIAFKGVYEADLSRMIVARARTGGTMIDVGANMGYFALLWAAARPDNRVIAYEASPSIAALMKANVERNSLGAQIAVVEKAASDKAGAVRFYSGPADQTGWGGIKPDGDIEVAAVRLDDEVTVPFVDVLKIDVEGADALVLRGCERLLREGRIGRIFFEFNGVRSAALGLADDAAQQFLATMGYASIQHGKGLWSARAH